MPAVDTRGVECPECGSAFTLARRTGFDQDGQRIRQRICKECDHDFGTIEIALPPEFSWRGTDVSKGDVAHESYVKKRKRPVEFSRKRKSSDRIIVNLSAIRIEKGKYSEYCRRGLHKLTDDNLYVGPRGDQRICRTCKSNADKRYRAQYGSYISQMKREAYRRTHGIS